MLCVQRYQPTTFIPGVKGGEKKREREGAKGKHGMIFSW